jgi:hypothetical protein
MDQIIVADSPQNIQILKNKNNFLVQVVIGLICLAIGISIGWYIGNNTKIEKDLAVITTQERSRIENDEMVSVYQGSSSNSLGSVDAKFTLQFPKSCVLYTEELAPGISHADITCILANSRVIILPQAGGSEPNTLEKKDTVELANGEWERTYFDKVGTSWHVTYGKNLTDSNASYQLIEVDYTNYSDEAETEVEKIVGSMKPL